MCVLVFNRIPVQCLASDIMNTQTAWLPYLTAKFWLINETVFSVMVGPWNVTRPGKTFSTSTILKNLMASRKAVRAPPVGSRTEPRLKMYFRAFLHYRNCIWWHQISCFCCVKCKQSKYRIYRTFSQNIRQYRTLFKNIEFIEQVGWLR